MQKKLKDIASILMGYSFRNKLEKDDLGNVSVIQMKDLSSDYKVNIIELAKSNINEIKENYIIKKGDIIFRTRGLDSTACIFDIEMENVVLAAPLLRVRVKEKSILPDYLLWYVNQFTAQTFLNINSIGTTQKMITKQILEKLIIDIPSVEMQKQVVALSQLAQKEQLLLKQIADKKKKYIAAILIKGVRKEK